MSGKYQNKYRVESARLKGYDYGQNGACFLTICTKDRLHFFGDIVASVETQNIASLPTQNIASPQTQNIASLRATPIGVVAHENWLKIPEHFPFIILDEFIVMPNHIHGILIISKAETCNNAGTHNAETHNVETHNVETHNYASLHYINKFGPQSGNISSVMRGYKASVKSFATINQIEFGWQPRFHDRIIRDKEELNRIRRYIIENPGNWARNRNNETGIYI